MPIRFFIPTHRYGTFFNSGHAFTLWTTRSSTLYRTTSDASWPPSALYRTEILLDRTQIGSYLIELGKRGKELGSYLIRLGKRGAKIGSYLIGLGKCGTKIGSYLIASYQEETGLGKRGNLSDQEETELGSIPIWFDGTLFSSDTTQIGFCDSHPNSNWAETAMRGLCRRDSGASGR